MTEPEIGKAPMPMMDLIEKGEADGLRWELLFVRDCEEVVVEWDVFTAGPSVPVAKGWIRQNPSSYKINPEVQARAKRCALALITAHGPAPDLLAARGWSGRFEWTVYQTGDRIAGRWTVALLPNANVIAEGTVDEACGPSRERIGVVAKACALAVIAALGAT